MSKKISPFRFKQFAVSHHRSSMKVGVDGVLIGSWADINGCRRILDVGTGCGLIALILAQRVPEARIDANDIDESSIEEAKDNIASSPWSDRVNAHVCPYSRIRSIMDTDGSAYDLIISNPPYFDSGVTETVTAREKARHQGDLSPSALLEGAADILNPGGSVAMVVPVEMAGSLEMEAKKLGYWLQRKCRVRGHAGAPYKRVLLQWRKAVDGVCLDYEEEFLTLEVSPGIPTEEYHALCKDFYLRF